MTEKRYVKHDYKGYILESETIKEITEAEYNAHSLPVLIFSLRLKNKLTIVKENNLLKNYTIENEGRFYKTERIFNFN